MIPLRSREKGRQVSGETTRIASHDLRNPCEKIASEPPVIASSIIPERTIQKACPMAWLAEEHAVDTVYTGPLIPVSIDRKLAPALAITRGMVSGWTRPRFRQ